MSGGFFREQTLYSSWSFVEPEHEGLIIAPLESSGTRTGRGAPCASQVWACHGEKRNRIRRNGTLVSPGPWLRNSRAHVPVFVIPDGTLRCHSLGSSACAQLLLSFGRSLPGRIPRSLACASEPVQRGVTDPRRPGTRPDFLQSIGGGAGAPSL